jgi:acyl carrier protein
VSDLHNTIRAKVLALAEASGNSNAEIGDDEIIPETGLVSSAGIVELVLWVERQFGLAIDDDDITVDKLGSIALIAAYVTKHRGGR